MKIRAAVTYEQNAPFRIEDVELSEPADDEILTKMAGCGVCHTDEAARRQLLPVPLPAVLGHEGSGIVEKVGKNVSHVKPGDHVVFSPYSCGECSYCVSGHPAACEQMVRVNFGGIYPDGKSRIDVGKGVTLGGFFYQSAFATYAITNKRNTIKIPDLDVDIALLGPLSCGIQTGAGSVMNVLRPSAGNSIAIFGCGGVGLSAVMAAKLSGCCEIIGVDRIPERLSLAASLGCTHVISGKDKGSIADEIGRICGGVDFSLDTTGVPALVTEAVNSLKKMGTCALAAAMGDREYLLQLGFKVQGKAARITGVLMGDSNYPLFLPKLVKLYKRGVFPFDRLTKYYDFEDIEQAFADSVSGVTIKPVIRF